MDARIVEFAEILRQNGLRVGTGEVCDAGMAAALVDLADREGLRAALRATLVKRSIDAPTFDRAFELFFSGAARMFEALEASLLRGLEEEGLLEGDDLKRVLATLGQLGGQLSPLTEAALSGDRGRLAALFRAASLQLDLSQIQSALQTGFFARRLAVGAGSERMRSDLSEIERELTRRGLSPGGLEVVSRALAGTLRGVEDAARAEVGRQARARVPARDGGIAERPFSALGRADLEAVQSAVRRLAERLKTRLVRRQRSRRRGALHARRTLRRNMTSGGVPMVPQFRARRPERPDVVVLCDVSDSVRNASRLMLLFMHTLQSLFVRVRSFVFVSELGEVTELFRGTPVEEAVDLATAGRAVSLQANSNYGQALAGFVRTELASLTRRTTVLVIGDGRNNYNPANVWALREIRRKCKRLLWICPEERRGWGFGDSEMATYAQACDRVVIVQGLADLTRVADQLVPA